jgi:hypothetical protein
MPTSGQGINGTGLNAALMRIARQHAFQFYGTNTMANYWAYTNALLGQGRYIDRCRHSRVRRIQGDWHARKPLGRVQSNQLGYHRPLHTTNNA